MSDFQVFFLNHLLSFIFGFPRMSYLLSSRIFPSQFHPYPFQLAFLCFRGVCCLCCSFLLSSSQIALASRFLYYLSPFHFFLFCLRGKLHRSVDYSSLFFLLGYLWEKDRFCRRRRVWHLSLTTKMVSNSVIWSLTSKFIDANYWFVVWHF